MLIAGLISHENDETQGYLVVQAWAHYSPRSPTFCSATASHKIPTGEIYHYMEILKCPRFAVSNRHGNDKK